MKWIQTHKTQTTIFVTLVIAIAVIVCFGPLLQNPCGLLVGKFDRGQNDLSEWMLPHRMVSDYAGQGIFGYQLWCPWWGTGSPYLGNPNQAVFYPANVLFWIFSAIPTLSWTLVIHHIIAATGSFILSQRLGSKRVGSVFCAISFGFSPSLLARTAVGHILVVEEVSWYPWVFYSFLGLCGGKPWSMAGLVLTLSLTISAGHLQEAFYLCLTLSVLCVIQAYYKMIAGHYGDANKLLVKFVKVGVITGALLSFDLIPIGIYLGQVSTDARLDSRGEGIVGQANLLQLIHPFALGDPGSYRGPGWFYWETLCHSGLVTLCMMSLGIIVVLKERPDCHWIIGVAVTTFLLAFGTNIPGLGWLIDHVPVLAMFRCPGRWLLLTSLMVSVLSGFGVDTIATKIEPYANYQKKMIEFGLLMFGVLLVVVLVIGCAALGKHIGNPSPANDLIVQMNWEHLKTYLTPWFALSGAIICMYFAQRIPEQSELVAICFIFLSLFESAGFAQSLIDVKAENMIVRKNPLTEYLAPRMKGWRVSGTQEILSDSEALRGNILKVQQYEPLPLKRIFEYLEVAFGRKVPFGEWIGVTAVDHSRINHKLLNFISVQYIVSNNEESTKQAPEGWIKITPLAATISNIWKNPSALPRGYVVGKVVKVNLSAEKSEVARKLSRLDPETQVILENDILPSGPRQTYTPALTIEDTPNRLVFEVKTEYPGYLVLCDAWYPGWSGEVDGRSTSVLRANHAFRAVALPEPGHHRIIFSYEPLGMKIGFLISSSTIVLLVLFVCRTPITRFLTSISRRNC